MAGFKRCAVAVTCVILAGWTYRRLCPSPTSQASLKSASLTTPGRSQQSPAQDWGQAALRDGVLVLDGDMLVPQGAAVPWGVVHYGRPWPGGKVRYRFSSDAKFRADKESKQRIREAVRIVEERTDIDWIELPEQAGATGSFVEIRIWDKRWGSAQVGFVGDKQVVNLPSVPSVRLVLHEFGHVMGLGHEHQHPDRDKFVKVDRSCVPEEHRESFAPRSKHVVSRSYDVDSIMHYRSAGFCRKDEEDVDEDGNTRECAYIDDDPKKGKCYALTRAWGACRRDNCEDRDGDGFREYIKGAATLSQGDVRTIHALHKDMLHPSLPGESFGASMVAGDSDGDGEAELYVAALQDGDCGALWELRLNKARTGWVRYASTPTRWRCEAGSSAKVSLKLNPGRGKAAGELWIGVAGPDSEPGGGWVEQWRRAKEGDLQLARRIAPQQWGAAPLASFGASLAVLDRDGDGLADDLAIGAPGQGQGGRVFYAQGLSKSVDPESGAWARVQGQLAGAFGVGQALSWVKDGDAASLILGVGCSGQDEGSCEPSLWHWSERHPLNRLFSLSKLGLSSDSEFLALDLASDRQGHGLWLKVSNGCGPDSPGNCGAGFPLRWTKGGLELDRLGVVSARTLGLGPLASRGMVAIDSVHGRAMVLQSEAGQSWVAIERGDGVQYHQLQPPKGMQPGSRCDFGGWWDARGLFVVQAWTDLQGERHLGVKQMTHGSMTSR